MEIRQLLEINQLRREDFNSSVDYKVEVVSICRDIDPEEIYEWPLPSLIKEFGRVVKILNASPTSSKSITVDSYTFHKVPFNKLTLGEYIDMEHYLKRPDGLLGILLTLYRQEGRTSPISPIEYEPYGDFPKEREELFGRVRVEDVVGVKGEYTEWVELLHKSYSALFEPLPEEEEEEEGAKTISELVARQNEEQQRSFVWEGVILALTGGDATRYEEALKMPIIMVFNMLSKLRMS